MESKTSVNPKYINLKYAFPKRLVLYPRVLKKYDHFHCISLPILVKWDHFPFGTK